MSPSRSFAKDERRGTRPRSPKPPRAIPVHAMREYQFDGLVGPTHNYGGLSSGNVASTSHGGQTSNPRAAALQGLAKMKFVRDLGVRQAVLPPHDRPHLS